MGECRGTLVSSQFVRGWKIVSRDMAECGIMNVSTLALEEIRNSPAEFALLTRCVNRLLSPEAKYHHGPLLKLL